MNAVHIVPVGCVDTGLLDQLAADLALRLEVSCHVETRNLDPAFACDTRRNQFWSTAILKRLTEDAGAGVHALGVTEVDLFVPVLTFVFGEAQVNGHAAVVSCCRLRNEFYGLPPSPELLRERLRKESLHELGHNLGLRHCPDWQCVMTSSHGVEKLDVKDDVFCSSCVRVIRSRWRATMERA